MKVNLKKLKRGLELADAVLTVLLIIALSFNIVISVLNKITLSFLGGV